MANPNHVKELLKGVEHWNNWLAKKRKTNPDFEPDLEYSMLVGENFRGIDLTGSNLKGAYLTSTRMEGAKLMGAHLEGTEFQDSHLEKANLSRSFCNNAIFISSHLQQARIINADLRKANFTSAHLEGSALNLSNCTNSKFYLAHLDGANITGANICRADLRYADLIDCHVADIKYSRWEKYKGIRLDRCQGNQRFRLHAKDQAYIEEFRTSGLRNQILYYLWLIFSDCGRSFLLWSTWSVFFALGFGAAYARYSAWPWLPDWLQHLLIGIAPKMDLPSYESAFSPYYFSIVTFTTLGFGDIHPSNMAGEIWVTLEVILGYVMLGGLISIFANKLARRGG